MADTWLAVWETAVGEFPLGGSAEAMLRGLIQYGIMAPSSHNSQPWRFRLQQDVLELRIDPRGLLPVSDPAGDLRRVSGS